MVSIAVKIYIVAIPLGAVLALLIFYSVGFTPAIALGALSRFCPTIKVCNYLKKPLEGSLAGAWHASIGNVVAGSAFAILQSLGTAPLLLAVIGALTSAVGCFVHYLWKNVWGEGKDGEWCIWRSEKA
jgi:hypothetical protein